MADSENFRTVIGNPVATAEKTFFFVIVIATKRSVLLEVERCAICHLMCDFNLRYVRFTLLLLLLYAK